MVFSAKPALFVLLSDRDQENMARLQPHTRIYVLFSRTNSGQFLALTEYFPALNNDSSTGMTLVDTEGDWRLYRIEHCAASMCAERR